MLFFLSLCHRYSDIEKWWLTFPLLRKVRNPRWVDKTIGMKADTSTQWHKLMLLPCYNLPSSCFWAYTESKKGPKKLLYFEKPTMGGDSKTRQQQVWHLFPLPPLPFFNSSSEDVWLRKKRNMPPYLWISLSTLKRCHRNTRKLTKWTMTKFLSLVSWQIKWRSIYLSGALAFCPSCSSLR